MQQLYCKHCEKGESMKQNQQTKGGKKNLINQIALWIGVGILPVVFAQTGHAGARIGCLSKDSKEMRTWISADISSDNELQSVRYRLKNPQGMIVEDTKIKMVQADKDLSDKKKLHFNLTKENGGFEPELLVLPKKFEKQKQFEASLVQLTDGWGSVDNVTTTLSCRKLPVASR